MSVRTNIIMELVEGDSPPGPLSIEEALSIARQIADPLAAAQHMGIIHRDLKPPKIKDVDEVLTKAVEAARTPIAANTPLGPPLKRGCATLVTAKRAAEEPGFPTFCSRPTTTLKNQKNLK
jgi:hypothetical protein